MFLFLARVPDENNTGGHTRLLNHLVYNRNVSAERIANLAGSPLKLTFTDRLCVRWQTKLYSKGHQCKQGTNADADGLILLHLLHCATCRKKKKKSVCCQFERC